MTIRVHVRRKPDRDNLQLYYIDPLTGLERTKSAGTEHARKAERAAAEWETELNDHGVTGRSMSWEQFREHYESSHLSGKARRTRTAAATAMNWFERTVGPVRDITLVDSMTIARMTAQWRSNGMKDSTIGVHLRHLRAAFGWAYKMQLIAKRPVFPMPASNGRLMKGRPITVKECRQLLRAAREHRPSDWQQWVRFIRGLWLSGLRLEEAVRLSWDSPPLQVDLDGGRFPRVIIQTDGQKSRRAEIMPLTPDFAHWLRRTPPEQRFGRVLPMYSTLGRNRPLHSSHRIGRVLSEIGVASAIVVNDDGKHVSAHDLRRAFGTRWSRHVKPLTLQKLMRHASIETTLRYYVEQDADEVAEELWAGDLYPRLYRQSMSSRENAEE